ncbi:DeoR/GlpR family DNA-binding transcription regulator [Actinoallomurus purpureus]|uniref:DeoR/GlpR family DNA-binding transcription regulator n=1 Tax=Actinoallomurus purpureus TaxID=478114 RepID=UPI0020936972|nr:DeoR/GlpR family DNA-binding transcription regulator [Actinoallomurus purpureus]MCO6010808.1 DeoR/GlpR family DNA-binding transcription regulator [Actinoallomurus purpureus]
MNSRKGREPSGPARRQNAIAEFVVTRGSATAADLTERFEVSLMTIHRDLDELARQGIVRKFRGGVTAQRSGVFESSIAYRTKSMQAEKNAIADKAVERVEPGMAIMLDDSTTALALARHLEKITPLTVVTNFLEGLNLLSAMRGIRLVALGGDYDALHKSFLGVSCVEAIAALRVDICFVSTSAVSGGHAYHQEPHVVLVKRAMLQSAERNFLLVDHTKLGRVALHKVASLTDFEKIITDDGAPPDALGELDNHKVAYDVALR